MALAMRARSRELSARWEARGFELSLGFGITRGLATLGAIGFDARSDYAAIGSVTRMAARLCEAAQPDEILVSRGVLDALGGEVRGEPAGELTLRGVLRPVPAFRILEADAAPRAPAPTAPARPSHDVFRQGECWTVVFAGRDREHCPPLARHLDASIRTGTLCAYRPPVSGDRTWLP